MTLEFIDEDIKLAVKNGAYWFDTNYPGWAIKIDLESLQMDSCYSCVIGQTVGDYCKVVGLQTGANDWAIENGFEAPAYGLSCRDIPDFEEVVANQYLQLETVWTEEVKKRLG